MEEFINVGRQCRAGYGCYQGAAGLSGYSAEPSRQTIMARVAKTFTDEVLRYDIASHVRLLELLSKYSSGSTFLNIEQAGFQWAAVVKGQYNTFFNYIQQILLDSTEFTFPTVWVEDRGT